MEMDPPQFSSKDDEIQYWMELVEREEDVERELVEFLEDSRALEKEQDTLLEQAEKANREFRHKNTRLTNEVEQLRARLDQQMTDCAAFQAQAQDLQSRLDQLVKYIRELEQKNDDLERAQRVNMVTEEEMEAKFDLAIERIALLETELNEKEDLKVMVQRLIDEIRDYKQDIRVLQRHQRDNDKSADRICGIVVSNKLQVELETTHAPSTGIPTPKTPAFHRIQTPLKSKVLSVPRKNSTRAKSAKRASPIKALRLSSTRINKSLKRRFSFDLSM